MPAPRRVRRLREKRGARRALDDPPVMQERDLVGEPAGLPQIVRDQHHARPLRPHGADQPLDGRGRRRIEVGGGLVQDQDLRAGRQRAGDRQQLLLAARQHAGRRHAPDARAWRARARPARAGRAPAAPRRRPPAHTRRWPAPSGAAARAAETRSRSWVRGAGREQRPPRSPRPPSARPGPPARARAGSCRRRSGRSAPACRCRRSRCRCRRGCAGRRARTRGPRRGSAGWRRRLAGCRAELHADLRHRPSERRSPASPSPAH